MPVLYHSSVLFISSQLLSPEVLALGIGIHFQSRGKSVSPLRNRLQAFECQIVVADVLWVEVVLLRTKTQDDTFSNCAYLLLDQLSPLVQYLDVPDRRVDVV